MCLKKSFMEVIYLNKLEKEFQVVVSLFEKLKKENEMEYVPIDYFFIYENLNREIIYKLFHILLEYKIIDKVDFIECDSCGEESIYTQNEINICYRCKESIYSDHIVEKFKLVDYEDALNEIK